MAPNNCPAFPIGFTIISYPGASDTGAEAVNNGGIVVGFYDDSSGNTHGFQLLGGTYTTLDFPSASATFAKGINDGNLVVGDIVISGNDLGFQYSGGLFTSLSFPGSDSTDAAAINNAGTIGGTYVSGGAANGFLYSSGVYTPLDFPGADDTFLGGIDNSGQVAGSYDISGANYGFLDSGGSFTTLAYPGAIATFATGINNLGQVTGFAFNAGGTSDGFLYSGGNYTLVDYPGAVDTYLKGSNDNGTYVGFFDYGGAPTGFAVVTPEPGPFVLLLTGLVALFWLRRRKSRLAPHVIVVSAAALLTLSVGLHAHSQTLSWVYPLNTQSLGGNDAMLFVASSDLSASEPVDFDYSLDNVTWVTMPPQEAADYGTGAFTTAIDATAFPVGTVYFRARFDTNSTGPVISVQITREPSPSCSVTRLSSFDISFDCSASTSTNGSIASYAFDFGDGSNTVSSIPKVSHTYSAFGIYPVAVTLTDSIGMTSTLYKQLYLVQLALLEDRPACGCASMTLNAKTGNMGVLGDPRRPKNRANPAAGFDLDVLGPDTNFISFNFEVSSMLTKGSDVTKCTEGQLVKRTGMFAAVPAMPPNPAVPAITNNKMACSAGRKLPSCTANAQCDTLKCMGGTSGETDCNTAATGNRCLIGGGMCMSNNDGTCTTYALAGANRGNDDYRFPTPDDGGIKLHRPPTGAPVWSDFPGLATTPQAVGSGSDFRYDGDFLSFVNGPGGNCSCHFTLVLDWDNAKKQYRPATAITLVKDAETANCTINQ